MRELFAEVFGHEMSHPHWAWKYANGHALALLRDGRMVAHYGGLTRPVSYLGRPALACQVCDVMVRKSANTALARRGPLYQVAAAFLESQIGHGLPHLLGYGFPNRRAFLVAQRLGLYGEVDRIVRLDWTALHNDPADGLRCSELGDPLAPADRRALDRLWRRMAAGLRDAIVPVRDARWLEHRYLRHPQPRYELLLVRRRWTRRLVGALVLRRHEQHLELLDLIGAPAQFGTLITVARQRAAAAGLERVECWITASQQQRLAHIDPPALTISETEIVVPANMHTAGPGVDALRGRWFLMSGDADFT